MNILDVLKSINEADVQHISQVLKHIDVSMNTATESDAIVADNEMHRIASLFKKCKCNGNDDAIMMITLWKAAQQAAVPDPHITQLMTQRDSYQEMADLELSTRTFNLLIAHKISTVDELIGKTRIDLLKLPNLGNKILKEIEGKLKKSNLSLKNWNEQEKTPAEVSDAT